jgi:outer membrane murein-binding lipoprotein Lpp
MRNLGATVALGILIPLAACVGTSSAQSDSAAVQTIATARDAFENALPKLKADVAACQMDSLRISLGGMLANATLDVDNAANMASISPEVAKLQAYQLNSAAQEVLNVRAGIEQCRREMAEMEQRLAKIDKRCETPTRIGMTERQVEASCWGIPDHVNRTETASHVSEQWVYPVLGYLYFEDGRLTTIQQNGP